MKITAALLVSAMSLGVVSSAAAQGALPVPMLDAPAASSTNAMDGGLNLREGQSADLFGAVELINANVPVTDVQYIDWFDRGDFSAIVRTDDCDEGICQWLFVTRIGDGYEPAGGGYSANIAIEQTDGTGRIIAADGVKWAWTGYEMVPWGDIVSYVTPRAPRSDEIAQLKGHLQDASILVENSKVWDIDPFGAVWNHHLVELPSGADNWGAGTRYVILNRDGHVILDDNFEKRPYIFPTYERRAAVIAYKSDGLTQMELFYKGDLRR